jgi:hypothetical protein
MRDVDAAATDVNTYLLVQHKFGGAPPLPLLRHPYLDAELLARERVAEECLRLRLGQARTRETLAAAARAEVLEDGVGVEDVLGNVERVRPVRGVVLVLAEEEPDRAALRRLFRELVEETAEAGVGICLRLLVLPVHERHG